jgi:hypothetical protein
LVCEVIRESTYSVSIVVGRPECLSVLGVVSSSETILGSVVQVRDTVSNERISVGVVDLLFVSSISLDQTYRSVSDHGLEPRVIVIVEEGTI